MRSVALALVPAVICLAAGLCPAQIVPVNLSLQPDDVESVYAPPEAATEEQGTNLGGVRFNLDFAVLTDYVFRGINRSESTGQAESANFQFDGVMRFDLGKLPSLFLGVFTNINNSDPISQFEEIRPYFGLELNARPFIFAIGNTFYIYPDRDEDNSAEVWARLTLDDSYFFRTDDPIIKPYLLVAYDYDTYQGLYLELGVSHDFSFDDLNLTITPMARVAYVSGNALFRAGGIPADDPGFGIGTSGPDSGFQHYELGMIATYGLNQLLNIPSRYGKIDLKGYLFYTDGIDDALRASTELYGGVGIGFSY